MEEFINLKNELSNIITEKHKNDNLIDIILFKSKINKDMNEVDQEKLKDLNKKVEELSAREKEIRERMEQLRKEHEES